jgi:hypothetical protein
MPLRLSQTLKLRFSGSRANVLWALAVSAFLVAASRQLGLRGGGSLSRKLYSVGELGRWLVIVLTAFFVGLTTAIEMAVGLLLIAPVVLDLLLFPLLRKGSMTTFADFRSIVPWRIPGPNLSAMTAADLERLITQPNPRDAELKRIAERKEIARALSEHGKTVDDLLAAEHDLIRLSLGYRIPRKVVSTPKLPEEYFELRGGGASDYELTRLYLDRFGWVT